MAEKLATMYQRAKKAGFPTSEIRGKSASEIEELLNGGGNKSTVVKKSAVKKAVATVTKKRGRGRPKGSKNKTTVAKKSTATATKKRGPGRPKGSTNKTTRRTATKSKPVARRKMNTNSTDGRHTLSKVNYSKTEGWNPRDGSPPDRIIKALKRNKGDREKVFDFLKGDIWDFMGKVKRNGQKRTKAEAEEMLRYRIARTEWQFALATGQHKVATGRVEYGTGGTGQGTFKRNRKTTPKKSSAKPKRGRPAKSTNRGRPSASKAPARSNDKSPKEMSTAALKRYVKSFEHKRGARPAKYAVAVKVLAKR